MTLPGCFPIGVLVYNQCFFALMHVLVKPALHFIPPTAFAMMRVSLALPFLLFLAWKEGSLPKIDLTKYPGDLRDGDTDYVLCRIFGRINNQAANISISLRYICLRFPDGRHRYRVRGYCEWQYLL